MSTCRYRTRLLECWDHCLYSIHNSNQSFLSVSPQYASNVSIQKYWNHIQHHPIQHTHHTVLLKQTSLKSIQKDLGSYCFILPPLWINRNNVLHPKRKIYLKISRRDPFCCLNCDTLFSWKYDTGSQHLFITSGLIQYLFIEEKVHNYHKHNFCTSHIRRAVMFCSCHHFMYQFLWGWCDNNTLSIHQQLEKHWILCTM